MFSPDELCSGIGLCSDKLRFEKVEKTQIMCRKVLARGYWVLYVTIKRLTQEKY